MRRWLILWEMICWMKWNEKMVIFVMTMILPVRSSMKCITTLNLCLMPLKKILEINYTYGSLKQPTEKIPWRVTVFLISQRMGYKYDLFIAKVI